MIKRIVLTAVLFIFAFCLGVFAQTPPPPLPSHLPAVRIIDSSEITQRSNELERVKRDADKAGLQSDRYRQLNYTEIKKDFEQMQVVFDSRIVRTYKTSNPMDYIRISNGAAEIMDRAIRLKLDLFSEKTKRDKFSDENGNSIPLQERVKTLIVNLNEALRGFVTNPIFQNAKVIDPKDSDKAKADLNKIILLSWRLSNIDGK